MDDYQAIQGTHDFLTKVNVKRQKQTRTEPFLKKKKGKKKDLATTPNPWYIYISDWRNHGK